MLNNILLWCFFMVMEERRWRWGNKKCLSGEAEALYERDDIAPWLVKCVPILIRNNNLWERILRGGD